MHQLIDRRPKCCLGESVSDVADDVRMTHTNTMVHTHTQAEAPSSLIERPSSSMMDPRRFSGRGNGKLEAFKFMLYVSSTWLGWVWFSPSHGYICLCTCVSVHQAVRLTEPPTMPPPTHRHSPRRGLHHLRDAREHAEDRAVGTCVYGWTVMSYGLGGHCSLPAEGSPDRPNRPPAPFPPTNPTTTVQVRGVPAGGQGGRPGRAVGAAEAGRRRQRRGGRVKIEVGAGWIANDTVPLKNV